jgi:hypothetical protein
MMIIRPISVIGTLWPKIGLEEPSEARPKVDKHAKGEEAGDDVDDAGAAGVMIAPILQQPALRMPAPGRGENPRERSEDDGEDDKGGDADAL